MRRPSLIRVVLVFLLIGAVLNLLVAWGIALSTDLRNPTIGYGSKWSYGVATDDNGNSWMVSRHDSAGKVLVRHRLRGAPGDLFDDSLDGYSPPDVAPPHWSRSQSRPDLKPWSEELLEIATGWPMPSLSLRCLARNRSEQCEDCIEVMWRTPPRHLPLRPILPEMLGNTALYGAAAWLVLLGLFAARRFSRRRSSRCQACGYDLHAADHDRCPECGSAVKLAAQT